MAFRRTLDLRGYGQENPGHVVGVVEDGLEEGYPQELPRILAVRRKRGLARHEQLFQNLDRRGAIREKEGHGLHQQGVFLDPIELPQGIVGVGEEDIIQITVQNRIGIRGLRPRQGLQGNHAPQPEEGLGEDEVIVIL